MDRETFAKGMFILAAAYPDKELSQDTLEVYYSFLNHLTPAELEKAARSHIAKSNFFPRISELLQASREYLPSPIDAWNRLLAAARDGEEPEMDAATRKAMEFIGGWGSICYTPIDEHRFMFARFKEAFLEAHEQKQRQDRIGQAAVPQLER